MKKILLATTLLAATVSAASAEVSLSGDGRMGIVYDQLTGNTNFTSRARVKFTLSGETDGGLQFGGSFRADQATASYYGEAGSVYISGAFGKLSMGDVVGAAEAVLFDLPEVGLTDIGNNDLPFLTGDNAGAGMGPAALYEYSTGAFKFALSANDGYWNGIADVQQYAIGGSYTAGSYSIGLGYEVSDPTGVGNTAQWLTLGGTATFGTTTVNAFYADGSGVLSTDNAYGLGVSSAFNALTVNAFWQNYDDSVNPVNYYGIGASYDLGGGAKVVGGLSDNDAIGDNMLADVGVAFTF
jgi:outer membrane protein OmpU